MKPTQNDNDSRQGIATIGFAGSGNFTAVEMPRSLRRRNSDGAAILPSGSPPNRGAARNGATYCRSAADRYSAKRTRHHVAFFCDAPQAESVRLVGDFNGWDLTATPMGRMPDGRWMASLALNHGHHRYLFLVDGEPQLDPKATGIARDDQNNRVSLIAVS